jgi:hypothetical protein
MAEIGAKQNEASNLQLLRAQRFRYGQAKKLSAVQTFLATATPIVSAVVVAVDPTTTVWTALAGVIVSVFDAGVLDSLQRRFREAGATIQEQFDCSVLGLVWNEAVAGSPVDGEDIHDAASRYRLQTAAPVENWYPLAVDALPLFQARLICQRANCWWDAKLRRRYAAWIVAAVALVSVAVVVSGVVQKFTLEQFVLAVVAPLSPTILWALREVQRQRDTALASDRLRDHCRSLWGRLLAHQVTATEATALSRELQDAIFYRRKESSFVFDWVYRRLRDSYEEQMNATADQMVQELSTAQK